MVRERLSKSEQDYIKAIYYRQKKAETELVSAKHIAQKLEHAAPTVTSMLKRLEKKGFLEYQSYKGVSLTAAGVYEARFILKAHRVWEAFLRTELLFNDDDVHNEAEVLEHAASPKLIEKLYEYIGKPEYCPHGNRIPRDIFWQDNQAVYELKHAQHGVTYRTVECPSRTEAYLDLLAKAEFFLYIQLIQILDDETLVVQGGNGALVSVPKSYQAGWVITATEPNAEVKKHDKNN